MSVLSSIKNVLKASPAVRACVLVFTFGFILFISLVVGRTVARVPVITSIDPELGVPGGVMVVKGHNFGKERGISYVSIGGSKVTESGYLMWSENEIQIKIPVNVQDGLVVVGSRAGKSKPAFFANENLIPVVLRSDPETTIPSILSISSSANVGNIVTISGRNFGSVRGNSKVYFTANRDDAVSDQNSSSDVMFIPANESDFDYSSWSDSEIQVRIPDGAMTGPVYVKTDKGQSETARITVGTAAGKKSFYNKRTYVVQLGSDFSSAVHGQEGLVTLYIPKPSLSASQPSVELNECIPDPLIKDDLRDLIFQKQFNSISSPDQKYLQSYVVSVYSVKANINPKNISTYRNTKSTLYTTYTAADLCVPSGNETIISLKNSIVGRERNPYRCAELIYKYMLSNYEIEEEVRTGNVSPLDLLRRKSGDAYDFAVIYTALCRAAGIPSVPVSGILVDRSSKATAHWWTELYFEGFGWFNVDVALAAGKQFNPFVPVEKPAQYYFGNIENQHIAFSRGWKQIKASLFNSRVVSRSRTYALQSTWEEATVADTNAAAELIYNCNWKNPVITGIY